MKVYTVSNEKPDKFDEELNEFLSKIGDHMIVDIQYSSATKNKDNYVYQTQHSAMIIYCTKDEYRDIRLKKLLD